MRKLMTTFFPLLFVRSQVSRLEYLLIFWGCQMPFTWSEQSKVGRGNGLIINKYFSNIIFQGQVTINFTATLQLFN